MLVNLHIEAADKEVVKGDLLELVLMETPHRAPSPRLIEQQIEIPEYNHTKPSQRSLFRVEDDQLKLKMME